MNGPNTRSSANGGFGRELRFRRSRIPRRLRLRHEQLRRHQVQRRPRSVALSNEVYSLSAYPRLVHGPRNRNFLEYAGHMNGVLLVLIILVVGAIGLAVWSAVLRNSASRTPPPWPTPRPDARRAIDRLGGQVINLTAPTTRPSRPCHASERSPAGGPNRSRPPPRAGAAR